MTQRGLVRLARMARSAHMARLSSLGLSLALPGLANAQTSPFMTGATALQTNILGWLTPIAVILVMALGAMAMANRMSWG
jgi:type IV secretory pathway VirB2 component (pilin)